MVKSQSLTNPHFENINIKNLGQTEEFFIKGSESFIYNGSFGTKNIVIKIRKSKKYRVENLDSILRIQRLRIESRMIKSALNSTIPVPTLCFVDLTMNAMGLEKIEGENLGVLMSDSAFNNDITLKKNIYSKFGEIVGKLHNIEVIHGDLTPLNIIVDKENNIYIIDFGLAYYSNEIKDKSMDLFILFGALKIFHYNEELFDMFLQGYTISNDYEGVIDNFYKLTQKGRYKNKPLR